MNKTEGKKTTIRRYLGTAHLKNINNSLNTKIYSYLETSGGQSSNLHLNVIQFLQHQC
jgi:hypothetical protein